MHENSCRVPDFEKTCFNHLFITFYINFLTLKSTFENGKQMFSKSGRCNAVLHDSQIRLVHTRIHIAARILRRKDFNFSEICSISFLRRKSTFKHQNYICSRFGRFDPDLNASRITLVAPKQNLDAYCLCKVDLRFFHQYVELKTWFWSGDSNVPNQ